MSKSPPSVNNSNTPSPHSSQIHLANTSRHQTHESIVPVEHNSPASASPTLNTPSTAEVVAGSSRIHPRENETEIEQPMAKRYRTDPMGSRQSDRSSPSSDSQGGMADTEDGEQLHHSPPPSEPPKKKRTRTLTTPHQSAVLHALLAQSRFPTTAMREEVGRRIGLSARKVQIWFQNQRQKARRPRTSNEMPMTRPPQYGPFPSGGETEILNLYPRTQLGGALPSEPYTHRAQLSPTNSASPSAYAPPPSNLPSELLGPGVPGPSGTRGHQSPVSPATGATASHLAGRGFPQSSPSPTRLYNVERARPASSHTSLASYRDASRTLPPLVFPPHSRQSSSAGMLSIRSAPATMPPPSPFQRNRSPPFAFNPPSASTDTVSPSAALPPPFTLEPQPQWNDPIFTSVPTGSSTWSHRDSDGGGSSSPTLTPVVEQEQRSREGRYDPVRSVVVPYNSSPSPNASDHEGK